MKRIWLQLLTFCLGLMLIGGGIVIGILYSLMETQESFPYRAYNEMKIEKAKARLMDDVHVLMPDDKAHLIDCSDETRVYGSEPLVAYRFMEMFSGKKDPLNAFLESNNHPLFVHIQGLSHMQDDSQVFMGFRGDTAGVHRSLLTPKIFALYQENPRSVMVMPGSYARLSKDLYQSVCHRRQYPGVGYIGSSWPALNGRSWEIYSRLLGEHDRVFMFSYSNGGVARDEFLGTSLKNVQAVDISNAFDFARQHAEVAEFNSDQVRSINGLIDIETNYSRTTELWNLTKFLLDYVTNDHKKLYYAACSLESPVTLTHVYLINALNMIGDEMGNGVIRYQNAMRNIVIDILTLQKDDPYSYNSVNLRTQTIFLPNRSVTFRLHTGHFKIIGYAINEFNNLAKSRKLL